MIDLEDKASLAAEYIGRRVEGTFPVAVVLGSGLGGALPSLELFHSMPYEKIPGFPVTTVSGHHGNLLAGTLGGVRTLVMQGRFHLYEGYHMKDILLPLWTLFRLGVKVLVLTNASGGINPSCAPGDIVLVRDHINLMGTNPLVGIPDSMSRTRFVDLTRAYAPELAEMAADVAAERGVALKKGILAAVMGPVYETPAEIGMIERMGGDLVCMSTVPETIIANYLGMRVLALSLVCNRAAGLSGEQIDHGEVLKMAAMRRDDFAMLVEGVISRLPSSGLV